MSSFFVLALLPQLSVPAPLNRRGTPTCIMGTGWRVSPSGSGTEKTLPAPAAASWFLEGRTMFADCLRSLREKAGISQYRLAKQSGVSKQMVSLLELGGTQPSWETVQRLANTLGVDCRSF